MNVPETPRILVVDDNPAKLALIRRVLADNGAELIEAGNAEAALATCAACEFALFILDVELPGIDGFELAQRLSEQPATRETPIIFITANSGYGTLRLRGYGSGAVDYLVDPVNPIVLRSKVRVFIDLYRSRRRLQEEVAERRHQAELALHQATHDPLTGLPNRLLFWDKLAAATVDSRRRGGPCALLYVDIDGFKPVNDTHGHLTGDELLRQIAHRLRNAVRAEDLVARLGGDEFAVLLDSPQDVDTARLAASKIIEALGQPYYTPDITGVFTGELHIGASVGAALYPEHAKTVDDLMRAADDAMYRAKKAGKNRCVVAG